VKNGAARDTKFFKRINIPMDNLKETGLKREIGVWGLLC